MYRLASQRFVQDVGEGIRKAREAKGMSQGDLAAALGSSGNWAVSRWEQGNVLPRLDTFARICDVLGVSADSILFDERSSNAD